MLNTSSSGMNKPTGGAQSDGGLSVGGFGASLNASKKGGSVFKSRPPIGSNLSSGMQSTQATAISPRNVLQANAIRMTTAELSSHQPPELSVIGQVQAHNTPQPLGAAARNRSLPSGGNQRGNSAQRNR